MVKPCQHKYSRSLSDGAWRCLLLLLLLACVGWALSLSDAQAYPTNMVEDTFVTTSGIIRVLTPKVPIGITSPVVTKNVGDKLRLLQRNDEYFIAIVEQEYEKEQEKVCAFPLMSRKARQKSAWTTKSGLMFFGYKTDSCDGTLYLREGEELPVFGMNEHAYQAEIERYGHTALLWIPKSTPNIQFAGGPPPTPDPGPEPNRTIIRGTAGTTTVALVRGGSKPVLSDAEQGLSQRTHTKLSELFATQQKLKTTTPARVTTILSNEFDEPWFEIEEETPEPEPEPPPVVEEEPEVVEEPVPEVEEVVEVVEVTPATDEAVDTNVVEQAEKSEAEKPAAGGGFDMQAILVPVFAGFLGVLVLVVVVKKLKARRGAGGDAGAEDGFARSRVAGAGGDADDKDVDMSGHIASSSLGDVAQFLNAGKETGMLSIKDEQGEPLGRMVFDKGELVDAESQGHRGVEAVYDLLRHKDGFFSFVRQAEDSAEERTITQGTISLLLDVYRVIDEENSEM
ncbi:MAG: DUF4388 domain-containing protein [Spartobacteria bacterium]|nr:DUF4388 domain-containing protein [Spartobacteria bacterium]